MHDDFHVAHVDEDGCEWGFATDCEDFDEGWADNGDENRRFEVVDEAEEDEEEDDDLDTEYNEDFGDTN